jgi:indolepyruvate ferredoxin oxidoreductase, beta subunit
MKESKRINIYITGVGGQGIGLLSEVVLRAYDYAGLTVCGVDTHGLAQRGGIVRSHIRVGEGAHNPLIEPESADVVLALERTEALRSLYEFCLPGGTLVFYNANWQPLSVRLKQAKNVTEKNVTDAAAQKNVRVIRAYNPALSNTRMQNMVLLAKALEQNALPMIEVSHVRSALDDLLSGKLLEDNLAQLGSLL